MLKEGQQPQVSARTRIISTELRRSLQNLRPPQVRHALSKVLHYWWADDRGSGGWWCFDLPRIFRRESNQYNGRRGGMIGDGCINKIHMNKIL